MFISFDVGFIICIYAYVYLGGATLQLRKRWGLRLWAILAITSVHAPVSPVRHTLCKHGNFFLVRKAFGDTWVINTQSEKMRVKRWMSAIFWFMNDQLRSKMFWMMNCKMQAVRICKLRDLSPEGDCVSSLNEDASDACAEGYQHDGYWAWSC